MAFYLSFLTIQIAKPLAAELDLADFQHLELGPLAVQLDFVVTQRFALGLLAVRAYCFSSSLDLFAFVLDRVAFGLDSFVACWLIIRPDNSQLLYFTLGDWLFYRLDVSLS